MSYYKHTCVIKSIIIYRMHLISFDCRYTCTCFCAYRRTYGSQTGQATIYDLNRHSGT